LKRAKNKTAVLVRCAACGAVPGRETAQFCPVCGKGLSEDYQPLDVIRSSHRLHGRTFLMENSARDTPADLFAVNRNSAAELAWACLVYSFVPYLGILFVPFTVMIGIAGFGVFLRKPMLGGGRLSAASIGLSVVVFGIQVFLWWLLYIVPELSRRV